MEIPIVNSFIKPKLILTVSFRKMGPLLSFEGNFFAFIGNISSLLPSLQWQQGVNDDLSLCKTNKEAEDIANQNYKLLVVYWWHMPSLA